MPAADTGTAITMTMPTDDFEMLFLATEDTEVTELKASRKTHGCFTR